MSLVRRIRSRELPPPQPETAWVISHPSFNRSLSTTRSALGFCEMMSSLGKWRGKREELYHIIRRLARRHEERFEGKFPATSAVMGKELPRSIGGK
jgi:hypothetical protein